MYKLKMHMNNVSCPNQRLQNMIDRKNVLTKLSSAYNTDLYPVLIFGLLLIVSCVYLSVSIITKVV